jgi:hypothetical protein
LRRTAAGGAALSLIAGTMFAALAAFGGAAPAGATTNANTTYEFDCTTSLSPGTVAPYTVVANLATTPSTDVTLPGASFSASGSLTFPILGAVVGGLAANKVLPSTGLGLDISGLVIGSTDGSATGSYTYSHDFPAQATPKSTLTVSTFASGATSITVTSGTPAVGDGLVGTGLPTGEGVAAVSGSAGAYTVTLTAATTAAGGGSVTDYSSIAFTDTSVSTGSVFTTASGLQNGQNANIGATSLSGVGLVANLTVQFGATSGGAGVGTSNCLETGWQSATQPGPAQDGATAPALPFGATTPLVLASGGAISQPGTSVKITPPAAAYVTGVATAPTPNSQTVALGQGQTGSVTLTATAGSFPVSTFSLVGGSPQTIGHLTITQTSTGSAVIDLSNNATAPETDSFQFNACDNETTPVCSTTPGTITVKIGTPPVIQPFSEQVNGGLLVLSCDSPSNYVTGNSTPTPTANPLLQCPEFQFPSITLDGLEQQVTGTTGETGGNPSGSAPGTIYISDNRGAPTDTWTLSASFVATAVGSGNGENPNTSCGGIVAFCNSSVGSAVLNKASNGALDGQIAPNYLQVSSITCKADSTGGLTGPDGTVYNPPNLNPDATPTNGGNFGSTVSLCSASAGQSGGTFLYNATYTLTIPESVYAGNYIGSIQFTIQ